MNKIVMIKSLKELEEVAERIDSDGRLKMPDGKVHLQNGNYFIPKMIHLCNTIIELREWDGWSGRTLDHIWGITLPMIKPPMNRNGAND